MSDSVNTPVPAACETTVDLVGKFLSNSLTDAEREEFVAHIRGCKVCHDKFVVLELVLNLSR
jgi:hypothetical protein